MGQAKKVAGREAYYRVASELSMTVAELEQRMSKSEFDEWVEYFASMPTVNEIQTAQLTAIMASSVGVKNAKMKDFMLTKMRDEESKGDISQLTEAQINERMGL